MPKYAEYPEITGEIAKRYEPKNPYIFFSHNRKNRHNHFYQPEIAKNRQNATTLIAARQREY